MKMVELDVNKVKQFVIVQRGGSIACNNYVCKSFDTKEEAQEYAKRMRKWLSPGEKSYYGMGYRVYEKTKIPWQFRRIAEIENK